MAVAFSGASAAISGSAVGWSDQIVWPGSASRQLLLACFAFEGVAAGSGPYLQDDPGGTHGTTGVGWARILYRAPSATDSGIEVWAAYWMSGTSTAFLFTGTYSYVARGLVYTGQYDTGVPYEEANGTVRAATTDQWTGDDPEAPSVYTYAGEMVVCLAALEVDSPGFSPPTGYTERFDSHRASTFGNVGLTAADKLTTVEGATGQLPFTAAAEGGTARGTTATLAVRPADSVIVDTSPLIAVEYAVPLFT